VSLLDDIRKLAQRNPVWPDPDYAWHCKYCMEQTPWLPGAVPEHFNHDPDCPWLSMPKIVAALEAAEAIVQEHRSPTHPDTLWLAIHQLDEALS
jgi:hypothetical protein